MKKILAMALLSIQTTVTLACTAYSPMSVVVPSLNGIPTAGKDCKEAPLEQCFCTDEVVWEHYELVDNEVVDYISKVNEVSCTDSVDCGAKFILLECADINQKINNYDLLQVYCALPVMKIDGKKLVESPSKKAAYEAAQAEGKELEISNRRAKRLARKEAKESIDDANTVAKLKGIVKKLIEAQE